MFQNLTTLVADIGVSHSKIGFGGDEMPRLICPSNVAAPVTM